MKFIEQYEPKTSIIYKIACASNEGSDQPAHPRSLLKVFAGYSADNQKSMASSGGLERLCGCAKLFWVFAMCTCNLVGNAVLQLIFNPLYTQ